MLLSCLTPDSPPAMLAGMERLGLIQVDNLSIGLVCARPLTYNTLHLPDINKFTWINLICQLSFNIFST